MTPSPASPAQTPSPRKTEGIALVHDTFSRNTRLQIKQLFDAIRDLMTPPEPAKRPIGFVTPSEDKGKKGQAKNKTLKPRKLTQAGAQLDWSEFNAASTSVGDPFNNKIIPC